MSYPIKIGLLILCIGLSLMMGCSSPPEGDTGASSKSPSARTGGTQPPSESDDADKAQIRVALQELWDAYRLKDSRRLQAILDDDYYSEDGKNKDQQVAAWTSSSFPVKEIEADYKSAKIQLEGYRATVEYTATYSESANDESYQVSNVSSDIFVKRQGKWRFNKGTEKETVLP